MIDYKALAERVAQRAIYADNNADPNNKAWAADLRAVVSLLNGMADAQPVAWVDVADSYGGPYVFRGKELLPAGRHDLYTRPAPAAPQVEPKREPLTDEQIDAALQSDPAMVLALMSGEMTVGEFKAALRRLARTVERAYGIGGSDAE